MGVQHNAPGGKGPYFGRARAAGAGKGMVRTAGPNHPGGLPPIDNVRRLQRWPSVRSMRRVRQGVHELTDRRWDGAKDVRVLIERLNPVLRGWGSYFRTGNAASKFRSIDHYATDRLRRFLVKRAGRNLRAGRAAQWTDEWFWGQGLHRLHGTVRYPQPSMLHEKAIAKPDAGKPHVRFERGSVVPGVLRVAPGL
ncbi:MAG TPA: group II intron maturase-specific domain-containing protein [Candidatus Limnocylindria bacterium]|nr:group II intron maturase-specific domain-containing protein [Candidatus Limnocylindria bacterium]